MVWVEDIYLDKHFTKARMDLWWPMSCTVAIFMVELAMYMGFKEIVLLGQDCTYSCQNTNIHCSTNYMSDDYKQLLSNEQKKVIDRGMTFDEFDEHIQNMIIEDFKGIEIFAKKHKIKIYNATRGGRLEVFERVSLESLLKEK